jgi:hypothetical protein
MTHTEIRKILAESVVNPKNPSKWKIIADMRFTTFLDLAVEKIKNAEFTNTDESIKEAITLLAMARCAHRSQGVVERKPRPV